MTALTASPKAVVVGASVCATLASASVTLAQAPEPPQPTAVQEIVVWAQNVVRKPTSARSAIGAPIEVISVTRHVQFGDLDLTEKGDVAKLRDRIWAAAKAGCDQLESEFPSTQYPPSPPNQDCVKAASDKAMSVADEVIAAAR